MLNPDRFFYADPATHGMARTLYEQAAGLSIVSPHGHVDAGLFANPNARFGSPADLSIIPDHYITRMLYSQGIPFEKQRIAFLEGGRTLRDGYFRRTAPHQRATRL